MELNEIDCFSLITADVYFIFTGFKRVQGAAKVMWEELFVVI